MAHAFTLPDLGEGLGEGEITRWLVAEGESVDEHQPIVEIQTEKATVEIGFPWGASSCASSRVRARSLPSERRSP